MQGWWREAIDAGINVMHLRRGVGGGCAWVNDANKERCNRETQLRAPVSHNSHHPKVVGNRGLGTRDESLAAKPSRNETITGAGAR